MSGFEIRNDKGAITVNSDFTSPRLQRRITSPRWDIGYFDMDIPGIGNLNELRSAYETVGNTFVDWHQPGQIVWCRFAVGGWGMPGIHSYTPGKVDLAFTRLDVAVQSGYLDVFNSSGSLIWSAISAQATPRITGFIEVPAGYDLGKNTLSLPVTGTPFLPTDMFPGMLSEDQEGVGGKLGIAIKQYSGYFSLRYISQNTPNYRDLPLFSRGFRIPYATFPTF
ncbi:hypothetical protein SMY84_001767 [Cronobacter turicensis]|nr:hypothetical protein [Cronobacter turicensis]